jgi:S-adenosylmethionine synthetase
MPLPGILARHLAMGLVETRKKRHLPYLMPEGKVQVGIDYEDLRPVRIHSVTVTASQLYEMRPPLKKLRADIRERVIDPVLAVGPIRPDENTRIIINPDGTFLGGPSQHSGLTGRKNAIDTYGEYTRHSGKALSGKDPMRIDRVGAYAARYAAKNVVAAGLASECEVMLSYSIGLTKPVSLQVRTFGTGSKSDEEITALVDRHFDFRLAGILRDLDLRHLPASHPSGFYQKLAAFGHFGRADMDLPWERTDRADLLQEA